MIIRDFRSTNFNNLYKYINSYKTKIYDDFERNLNFYIKSIGKNKS